MTLSSSFILEFSVSSSISFHSHLVICPLFNFLVSGLEAGSGSGRSFGATYIYTDLFVDTIRYLALCGPTLAPSKDELAAMSSSRMAPDSMPKAPTHRPN